MLRGNIFGFEKFDTFLQKKLHARKKNKYHALNWGPSSNLIFGFEKFGTFLQKKLHARKKTNITHYKQGPSFKFNTIYPRSVSDQLEGTLYREA